MESKVYIQIDDRNRLVRIEGGFTTPEDLTGWIYIDEGEGDRYNLAQTHYLPKPILTDDFFFRYKYVNGDILERTEEEIDEDRRAVPVEPSQIDRVEAQAIYTALITDTLIEEV